VTLFRRTERRSISFQQVYGTGADTLGNGVERALRLTPVYASTRLLADDVASLPIHQFRDLGGDQSERVSASALVNDPTMFGTSHDWTYRAMTSLLLRGNAYGLVTEADDSGTPTRVEWLNPDEVHVEDDRAVTRPLFRWLGKPIPPTDLIHIPGYVLPGRVLGLSPIKAFALQVDTGLMAQQFGADFFRNGGHPSALLKNAKVERDEDAVKRVRSRFMAAVSGREPAVMTGGWEYEAIQIAPEESQFIETLKLNATQIAAIYGVPPERVGGESGNSMTYANVEASQISYVTSSLRPWVVRLERAFSRLVPDGQFIRFNTDALIRADVNARHRAHMLALQGGWLSVNEVRAIEDRPPIESGDEYLWPPMRMQLDDYELKLGADGDPAAAPVDIPNGANGQ
jgi:HK97 family phage portal protein